MSTGETTRQHAAIDPLATAETTGRSANPRDTLMIATAAFSCLVVTLLQSLVVPAIPRFPTILATSPTAVSWLVTTTLLTGAIATPVFGRLGDLLPRRRMMIVTMGLVFAGSIIAPLGGIITVIVGRGLQGMGTALIPIAMAQMRHSLPQRRLPGALALLSAMLGIGGGLGIPVGGVLLSWLGWESMFWFAAVMSLVAIAVIWAFIPAASASARGQFDIPGAVLLSLGLTAVLTAISQGGAWGWASPLTLGCFVASLVVFVAWVKVEAACASPLVNLRTSASRPILLTNLASILLGLLMFSNLLLTTLELQNPIAQGGFAWASRDAGLAMLPSAASMFAVAPISARLASRYGARAVVATGAAITTAGYVGRLLAAGNGGLVIFWATVVAIGVGIGYAGLPMMIVAHSPAAETGSANAVNALMRSIGMAASSAMVAAITGSLAVSVGDKTVPSATALIVIAVIGVVLGLGATLLSLAARASKRPSTSAQEQD